jgi:hypothetical protein
VLNTKVKVKELMVRLKKRNKQGKRREVRQEEEMEI